MEQQKVQAVGRRKKAVARIMLSQGEGKITVNGRTLENFFPTKVLQVCVKQPLAKSELLINLMSSLMLEAEG